MELIDTHAHLTGLESTRLDSILSSAKDADISKIICIGASDGILPNYEALELAQTHSNIYASIGLHPHDAGKHFWNEDLEELANDPKVVGIGETGLDYFKNWSDFEEQEKLFRETISIAKNLNKPLIIHCRNAHDKTIQILKEEKGPNLRGVFHCFGESAEIANQVFELDFIISLTGIITFKNAHALRAEIAQISLDQIMLETDSPYMAPEPYRGKESESAHVKIIAQTIANLHNTTIEEVAKKTTDNANKLFAF